MRSRINSALISVLSLFASSSVFAHISPAGEGWTGVFLHPFTGSGHLLMLVFLGIGIAYIVLKSRQADK